MTAEGSVYQRKDGRWVAQYRDARDKVRYIYRKSKGEARKALREVVPINDTVGLFQASLKMTHHGRPRPDLWPGFQPVRTRSTNKPTVSAVSRNHQCEGLEDLVEFAEGYLKERQPFGSKLGEVYERLERATR